jgi:hypothetical protein
MKNALLGVFGLMLVGCASSTVLMVGAAHPRVAPETVKVYATAPAHYEVIAIVNAHSNSGWSDQGKLDNALDELKSQAAKLGANGLLIAGQGQTSNGAVAVPIGNGMYAAAANGQQQVSAQAIFVTDQ